MEFHDSDASVTKSRVKAKKSLGQHFLTDQATLEHIANAAHPGHTILEIGPGLGALTEHLYQKTSDLILIEKDRDFEEHLMSTYGAKKGIELHMGDVLTWQLPERVQEYSIVANIPYFITTPIIKKFLLHSPVRPQSMTLLVQKEFAEKTIATPPRSTSLSVFIQLLTEPHISKYVPNTHFSPPPKVDSAVLHLKVLTEPAEEALLQFVEKAFHMPRKTLGNNLKALYGKEKITQLSPELLQRRPETLSTTEWKSLWKEVQEKVLSQ